MPLLSLSFLAYRPNLGVGVGGGGSPCVLNGFERVGEVPAVLDRPGCRRCHLSFGLKGVQVKHHSGVVGVLDEPHLQESRRSQTRVIRLEVILLGQQDENQKCV